MEQNLKRRSADASAVSAIVAGGRPALHRQPSRGSRTSSDFGEVVEFAVTFSVVEPRLKFVVKTPGEV